MDTYMGFLAVVGEIHLIETPFAGEIVYLYRVVSLSRRPHVSQCRSDIRFTTLN